MTKHRHKLRVDVPGLVLSISAILGSIALVWLGGKLGEHHALQTQEVFPR